MRSDTLKFYVCIEMYNLYLSQTLVTHFSTACIESSNTALQKKKILSFEGFLENIYMWDFFYDIIFVSMNFIRFFFCSFHVRCGSGTLYLPRAEVRSLGIKKKTQQQKCSFL